MEAHSCDALKAGRIDSGYGDCACFMLVQSTMISSHGQATGERGADEQSLVHRWTSETSAVFAGGNEVA